MIACELFFKEFYSHGSDDYLLRWAKEVDWMAAEGWKVIECCREPEHSGFWTVIFGPPKQPIVCAELILHP